jgi:CMP-N-acetylneuraminic acid synthetase
MNVAVIPAKGNSTRFTNKNIAKIHGRTLLEWTVFYARKNYSLHNIYVSTEDDLIRRMCRHMNVPTIPRPLELCGDQPLLDTYTHAYYYLTTHKDIEIDNLVALQVDNPDRNLRMDDELRKMDDKGYNLMISISPEGVPNGAAKIYSRYILTCGRPYYVGVMIDDCTNVHYEKDMERVETNLVRTWWYDEKDD